MGTSTDLQHNYAMPCYKPLHAFKGKSEDRQKTLIVFKRSNSFRGEKIDLPCGQCIGCRLERSRQWATRCMHEASMYEKNCFLTLTYDDESIPENGSLCLNDFQLFMKRLRKQYGKGIRYFHCGEYGENLGRPHYHALLFNHDFTDRKFWAKRNDFKLYTSNALRELWPMGHSVIGDVSFESAAYVARYVMKKVTGDRAADYYGPKIPEYTTMSRRPGIGKMWYEKFKGDVYPRDRVVIRGHSTRPPRFYDNILDSEDPALLALLKINREKNNKKYVTDVLSDGKIIIEPDSSDRRLAVKEVCKEAEVKNLVRPLEVSYGSQ